MRRKDEAQHGEYRTKRVIGEIYSEMAAAAAGGGEYSPLLDPPPCNGWQPPAAPQAHTPGERPADIDRPQQGSLFDPAPVQPSLFDAAAEPAPAPTPPPAARPLAVGDRVRHAYFGEGKVTSLQPSGKDVAVTVQFDGVGVKRMMLSLARLERV